MSACANDSDELSIIPLSEKEGQEFIAGVFGEINDLQIIYGEKEDRDGVEHLLDITRINFSLPDSLAPNDWLVYLLDQYTTIVEAKYEMSTECGYCDDEKRIVKKNDTEYGFYCMEGIIFMHCNYVLRYTELSRFTLEWKVLGFAIPTNNNN